MECPHQGPTSSDPGRMEASYALCACRVKSVGPPAQTLQDESGQRFTSRPAAALALRQHWKDIFGADQPADTHLRAFSSKYAEFIDLPLPSPSLDPITCTDLRDALGKMKGKAPKFDGSRPVPQLL